MKSCFQFVFSLFAILGLSACARDCGSTAVPEHGSEGDVCCKIIHYAAPLTGDPYDDDDAVYLLTSKRSCETEEKGTIKSLADEARCAPDAE